MDIVKMVLNVHLLMEIKTLELMPEYQDKEVTSNKIMDKPN